MRIARTALVSLALVTGLCTVGCSSDPMATDFKSIKSDLTPELQGVTERPVDIDRNIATTFEQNGRNFWNDLGRAFYVDRPSILSPYFIVPTGGQPR
jgi:hypothetical protein